MSIESYRQERKIQIPSLAVVAVCGVALAFMFSQRWLAVLFSTVFFSFTFLFLHTAFLALRFSLVELTVGVYERKQHALQFWVVVMVAILAGLAFFYRSVGAFHAG